MKRLLLFLVPDRQATLVAVLMSVAAFLMAMLDMMDRDFVSAGLYLNLSVGIMAALFVLKFVGMRATYRIAEEARQALESHNDLARRSRKRAAAGQADEDDLAQMAELAHALKLALNNIAADSPVRPKYEATLELIERISHKGG